MDSGNNVRSRFASLAQRFWTTDAAASAVEFAFVAPIFVAMLMAVAQIGLYFYYSASLYRATDVAVRQILVGNAANDTQVVNGSTTTITGAYFRNNILCPQLPGAMSCANVLDNIQVAPADFTTLENGSGTGLQPPASMNNANLTFCIGGPGNIITVQIFYAMPVLGLSWLTNTPMFNGQNVLFISATSVFQNEPFTVTSGFTGCGANG